MKPIAAPVQPGDQGAEVANLQEGLALLLERGIIRTSSDLQQRLLAGLAREARSQQYQEGTKECVAIFQRQHRLPAEGTVDTRTAAALNDRLQELGALDAAQTSQRYIVAGRVVQEEGSPFRGSVLLSEGGAPGLRLGEDAVDPEGGYRITYDAELVTEGTRLRVAAFDMQGNRRAEVIAAARPVEIVNLTVPREAPVYRVEGRVASASRAGVGGLRVRIVDRCAGPEVTLTEVATDEAGDYFAVFRYPGPKQRPDLQARICSGEVFLAASNIRYNASTAETLNVLLPDGANASLVSEHETLSSALNPHFAGHLRELQENDDRQDISYLANKTGWDARAVAMAALADQFSTHVTEGGERLDPQFYYALFRAGLPANEDGLYHADLGSVRSVWEQAVEQGIVRADLAREIPSAVQRFQQLAAPKLLRGTPLVGISPLGDMLAVAGLDETDHTREREKFVELYAEHRADPGRFWKAVRAEPLLSTRADRLELDGKLAFLTINNAPLMGAIHARAAGGELTDPLQLARQGYHRAARWAELLNESIPLPEDIPGDGLEVQRTKYAEYLAAQVRLSYPTASVAEMLRSNDPHSRLQFAEHDFSDDVYRFLSDHHNEFVIGTEPVEQFIARKQGSVSLGPEAKEEANRLHRVLQITHDDGAMVGLLARGIDSASKVVRYDRDGFVRLFAKDLGGAENAVQVHRRSVQVHNIVLNLAVSYLTAKNGIPLGARRLHGGQAGPDDVGQILRPAPKPPSGTDATGVIAYPTLEGLFGSMDYCACDHCRSVLSPAAYLVDLLQFLDVPDPHAKNPQDVLLERRPDIQHLPLTCENTNTAMPYIDVVNETLEYYIANTAEKNSLKDYVGHDTTGVASEDLLASPQFVMDAAYTVLRDARFPAPLPFHQPLENLRRYFSRFDVPLPLAMERLRKSDQLERGQNSYGWRDILMEEIGLSREEYQLLTGNPAAVSFAAMYGFAAGTSDADAIAELSKAKKYSRRVGISYEELVAILNTRFVNPGSGLIPKLQRLCVSFATLKALHDGTTTSADFLKMLPQGAAAPKPSEFGGDIEKWVKDNYSRIMGLITVAGPKDVADACDFGDLELRFAAPVADWSDTSTRLGNAEFIRLLRFIRLWRKLGWTIEQTDAALTALCPDDAAGVPDMTKLDRLGVVRQVMRALRLNVNKHLLPLLACWSDIGTHGPAALYQKMFLNPAILKQDPAFADIPFTLVCSVSPGATETYRTSDHELVLRAAFGLTADEFRLIADSLKYDSNTPLTVSNISAIFRRSWLARALKLSVAEFLLLTKCTGLDPFASPDVAPNAPAEPEIIRLIRLVQALRDASLKPVQALYLIWNRDLSGKSSPPEAVIARLAHTLRADLAAVETRFAVRDDPDGAIARDLLTLVYGTEATDFFFGLLNRTLSTSVPYAQAQSTLPQAVVEAARDLLSYDDFRKQLTFAGVPDQGTHDDIQKSIPAENRPLLAAWDALYKRNQQAVTPFFTQFPELKQGYDAYATAQGTPQHRRQVLLDELLPELKLRRKNEQALAAVTTAAGTDPAFTSALLNDAKVLHAANAISRPALGDLRAIEEQGLCARFYLNNAPSGKPDLVVDAVPRLSYGPPPTRATTFDFTCSLPGSYLASAPSTATIAGIFAVGDLLLTSINGVAVSCTVTASDTTPSGIAKAVVEAINSCTDRDPLTGLPINRIAMASSVDGVITFQTLNQVGPFTLACSLRPSRKGTFTKAGPFPASQTATVGGTPTKGDQLTTTITAGTAVDVIYPVVDGDTLDTIAEGIASSINRTTDPATGQPLCPFVVASSAGSRVRVEAVDADTAFTLACAMSGDASNAYQAEQHVPALHTLTVAGAFAPGDVLTVRVDSVETVYAVKPGDTAAMIAENLAASVATHANVPAVSANGVISISASVAGAKVALECSLSCSDFKSELVTPWQSATVAGGAAVDTVLTTTINGVAIPYKVIADHTASSEIAAGIVQAINAATMPDPSSGLPLNCVVAASSTADAVTIRALDHSTRFSLECSVSPGSTDLYSAGKLHPPSRAAELTGTPAEGSVVTTTINGVAMQHVVPAGATAEDVAQAIRDLIMATTTQDPVSGQPINTAFSAFSTGRRITITAAGTTGTPGTPTSATAPGQLPAGTGGGHVAGVWSGYLDAPQTGFYNFSVAADPGATVNLELDGAEIPMGTADAILWSNQVPISLRAGVLTRIQLTVTGLTNMLTVSWQSTGLPKQFIPAAHLYSETVVTRLRTAYVRFLKANALAGALKLSPNEIANLAAFSQVTPFPIVSPAEAALGKGWLNSLPVADDADTTVAEKLCDVLAGLLDFARLKAALSPQDERFLAVLKDPAAGPSDKTDTLLSLTGWDSNSLDALLNHFFADIRRENLGTVNNFGRVHDAFALLRAMGISAPALIRATTNEPDGAVVRDLQAALRARYDAADWRALVRPINDQMRGLRRDALVAYILHHMRSQEDGNLKHIDTPDKLFEYFLMDVQMEPNVETSRIRHALSSLQLFIERCLMNLEPDVSPASLSATSWEWMKRYRVWEANRKVFLWPENWLEPELRDDKSPFFKEIESELLQSDITEDAAATALLNYLAKLEEVAKLEPCGIYHVEADPKREKDAIDHVVARSTGANRKYYYRRREGAAWTPWEQIKLDIEDNPVIPVVWKDRLFLFWLRILKAPINLQDQASSVPTKQNGDPDQTEQLYALTLTELKESSKKDAETNTKTKVHAVLCWSEYFNGKWQPTRTSDVNASVSIGSCLPGDDQAFRSQLWLDVRPSEVNLQVLVKGKIPAQFTLYNTHSLPVPMELGVSYEIPPRERSIDTKSGVLDVSYAPGLLLNAVSYSKVLRRRVLNKGGTGGGIVATHHSSGDPWVAPFFYGDADHVFYIRTEDEPQCIFDILPFGATSVPGVGRFAKIPPLVLKPPGPIPPRPWFHGDGVPVIADPAVVRRFVTEDIHINQAIAVTGSVAYGNVRIGPAGAVPEDRRK